MRTRQRGNLRSPVQLRQGAVNQPRIEESRKESLKGSSRSTEPERILRNEGIDSVHITDPTYAQCRRTVAGMPTMAGNSGRVHSAVRGTYLGRLHSCIFRDKHGRSAAQDELVHNQWMVDIVKRRGQRTFRGSSDQVASS